MTRGLAIAKLLLASACLVPLVWLFLRAAEVGSLTLGANPVEEILNVCGKTGLNLLILTLCVTPIRRSTGINRLIAFRRMLGLFSFFYLVLHFSTYAVLDLGLAWSTLGEDIAERPYITVGFTALVLMVPLAITSTNALQRRLGRNWIKLHRLVYPIAILAVVHYWWQTKLDVADPLLYAFVLAVLLGARLAHSRELRRKRARSVDPKPAVAAAYQSIEPPDARQKARQ
jgi:sulfoxide reductase heme-binding subunit YedZ